MCQHISERVHLLRVRLVLRLGLGGGSPSPSRSPSVHILILNNIGKVLALYEVKCPLCRNHQFKNLFGAALPSLSRITLEKPRSKILVRAKFCPKKNKKSNISRGQFWFKSLWFCSILTLTIS